MLIFIFLKEVKYVHICRRIIMHQKLLTISILVSFCLSRPHPGGRRSSQPGRSHSWLWVGGWLWVSQMVTLARLDNVPHRHGREAAHPLWQPFQQVLILPATYETIPRYQYHKTGLHPIPLMSPYQATSTTNQAFILSFTDETIPRYQRQIPSLLQWV